MKTTLILLAFCSPFWLFSQEITSKYYGLTAGSDLLEHHTVALPDSGLIITGSTNTPDSGCYHVCLIRTDKNGAKLWQQTYFSGSGNWVEPTTDGGFIIGGNKLRAAHGSTDGFVMKVNKTGAAEWTTFLGLSLWGTVLNVQQLPNKSFIACGTLYKNKANGQDVFVTRLTQQGAINHYQENGGSSYDQALEVLPTFDNGLAFLWRNSNSGFVITRYDADWFVKWELNLHDKFQYGDLDGIQLKMAKDTHGDYLLAGGEGTDGVTQYSVPEILRISDADMSVTTAPLLNHDYIYTKPEFQTATNGASYCYFLNKKLFRLTLDAQFHLIARDSFDLANDDASYEIILQGTSRIFLPQLLVSGQNDIEFHALEKAGAGFSQIPGFTLSTGLANSNETYVGHCADHSGGFFVLGQRNGTTGSTIESYNYVFHIDNSGNQIPNTEFSSTSPDPFVSIKPVFDGGALLISQQGRIIKLDPQLQQVWQITVPNIGELIPDRENGFVLLLNHDDTYPANFLHYDSHGVLKSSRHLAPFQNSNIFGGISGGTSLPNGGFMFWGLVYFFDSYKPWVGYADQNGQLLNVYDPSSSEFYGASLTNFQFLATTDGSVVMAAEDYRNGVFLIKMNGGETEWFRYLPVVPDSMEVRIRDIDEIPCQGIVLSLDAIPHSINYFGFPDSTTVHSLFFVNLTENQLGNCTYNVDPDAITQNTGIPGGYTFHKFGSALHGQTTDIYYRSIRFPEDPQLAALHKTGKLQIMPNPAPGHTCFRYESAYTGLLDVFLVDMRGAILDHFVSEKTDQVWNYPYEAKLPGGMYTVRLQMQDGKTVAEKVIFAH